MKVSLNKKRKRRILMGLPPGQTRKESWDVAVRFNEKCIEAVERLQESLKTEH